MDKSHIISKAMEDYPLLRGENYVIPLCPICNNRDKLITICRQDAVGFPANYVICKQCGNIYFSKIPSREGYNVFYNKVYDSLTERGFKDYTHDEYEYINAFYEEEKDQGAKVVAFCEQYLFDGMKVLDLGCGMGGTLKAFQDKYGASCYGIEPTLEQVKIARDRLGTDNIFCGMAEDIDNFADDKSKFDLVIITAAIDHFYNSALVLNSLRSHCHEKTMLFILARDYKKSLTVNRCRSAMEHTTTFTSYNLNNLLRVTGYSRSIKSYVLRRPVYNQIWSLTGINQPGPYNNYLMRSLAWLVAGTFLSVTSKIQNKLTR